MKILKTTLGALVIGAAMLAAPMSANATATIEMMAFDGDWNSVAGTWYYQTTTGDPGNGNSCANSGSKWHSEGYYTPISIGPPFSGSASRTRYVTLCKNGDYLTVKLEIRLSGCAAWVCSTNWSWGETRKHGLDYDHKFYGTFNKELDLLFNPN